jgi:hypothetical protein
VIGSTIAKPTSAKSWELTVFAVSQIVRLGGTM